MTGSAYVISSGETLNGTTVTGGGTVTSIVLQAGDTITVSSGGVVENLALAGESLKVVGGGVTSNLTVGSGATETISSTGQALATSVTNGGTIVDFGTTAATISGLYVGSGGTLVLSGTTLSVSNPVTAVSGATVIFGGVTSGTPAVVSGGGNTSITISSTGLAHERVVFAGGITYTSTTLNGHPDYLITCFAAATKIATEHGEIAIETIKQGDAVAVMRNGQKVIEPVTWVGRSRIDLRKHAKPENAAPIRIKSGALAHNVPVRDLVVSPEHCLILDGSCVPVKLLVNGASIVREYPTAPFDYYHLELERHGILIADGAEAESYLDTGNRSLFDNADEPKVLHPNFDVDATSQRWKTDACAPLLSEPADVAPIWQTLTDRAAALGMVASEQATVADPDLHLLVDGQRIRPISDRDSRHVFAVPAGAKSVSLRSRYFIPADRMIAADRDTRRLGVCVNWIAIRSGSDETIFSADHPALQAGWYGTETSGTAMHRWTDGSATIPWDNIQRAAILTVRCTPASFYPVADEAAARLVA